MEGEPIGICRQSLAEPRRSISDAAVKELFSAFELVKARTLLHALIQSHYRPEIITTDEVYISVCDRAGPSCVSVTRSREYFDPISAISLHPNTALDKRWLCRRTCEKDPYRKTLSEALNIRGVRISQAKVRSPGNAPGYRLRHSHHRNCSSASAHRNPSSQFIRHHATASSSHPQYLNCKPRQLRVRNLPD
jgi:hypothetical protein